MDKKSAEEIFDVYYGYRFDVYKNDFIRKEVESIINRYEILKKKHGILDAEKMAIVEWLMERV